MLKKLMKLKNKLFLLENNVLDEQKQKNDRPWYQQPVFWILMAGPIIVVIAALYSFKFASDHVSDLVNDDYYKDGKHINLQIERDTAALKQGISAQVIFNTEGNAAKVFVKGNFNHKEPLRLLLLHPARKDLDQTINLQSVEQSGDQGVYDATIKPLQQTAHWYVRLEDEQGKWRVEGKWETKNGNVVMLRAMDTNVDNTSNH